MPIPRTIHQVWLQGEHSVPAHYRPLRRSWRTHHPRWEHRLWDEAAIHDLIRDRHPWFLPTWAGYTHLHQRVDAGRYFILFELGGVYADLDTECLRPLDGLFDSHPQAQFLVSEQPFGPLEARFIRFCVGARRILSNAVMASVVRYPPLGQALRLLPAAARRFAFRREMNITFSTGPAFLSKALDSAIHSESSLAVLPPSCFEPHFSFDTAAFSAMRARPDRGQYVAHSQDATWHAPFLRELFRSYFRLKHLFGVVNHG